MAGGHIGVDSAPMIKGPTAVQLTRPNQHLALLLLPPSSLLLSFSLFCLNSILAATYFVRSEADKSGSTPITHEKVVTKDNHLGGPNIQTSLLYQAECSTLPHMPSKEGQGRRPIHSILIKKKEDQHWHLLWPF